MIDLNVKADIKAVERQLDATRRKHIPKAAPRAIILAKIKVRTVTANPIIDQAEVAKDALKEVEDEILRFSEEFVAARNTTLIVGTHDKFDGLFCHDSAIRRREWS